MKWLKQLTGAGDAANTTPAQEVYPLVARKTWCTVCDAEATFTRVWRRAALMRRCPSCGQDFEEPEMLYQRFQPACPRCAEPLEQPGFDYGFCDRCGSKFEVVEGAKPGLLPNRQQRDEMNKHGRSWSPI